MEGSPARWTLSEKGLARPPLTRRLNAAEDKGSRSSLRRQPHRITCTCNALQGIPSRYRRCRCYYCSPQIPFQDKGSTTDDDEDDVVGD